MDIACFFLTPMAFAQQSLRRFTLNGTCSGAPWGHNARVVTGSIEYPGDLMGEGKDSTPHDDPRWPKVCASCAYEFRPEDEWQTNLRRAMKRGDHGAMWTTIEDAPVGAMWYADWYPWKGPDGQCLVVKTPGGDWVVDRPHEGGRGWTRTGNPPFVTASPSIHFPERYHGWLRDGVLIDA